MQPLLDDLNLSRIQDEAARQCIIRRLNLVEGLQAALRASQEENQSVRSGWWLQRSS